MDKHAPPFDSPGGDKGTKSSESSQNGSIPFDQIEDDLNSQTSKKPILSDEVTPENAAAILESVRIDAQADIPPPAHCLFIKDVRGLIPIGSLGDFMLIIGKAKSRKTFLLTLALVAALKKQNSEDKIQGCLPPEKNQVLYFDTEQSPYHVQKALQRICKLLDVEQPTNLITYSLRKFTPAERLLLIERALGDQNNLGMVAIDGIRDLVTSINDEAQATMISSKILKWTTVHNFHLLTLLHQNKNDENARGHLGAELVNKAETVLSVTKDKNNKELSTVKGDYCRNVEPEEFAFDIDENGLPRILNDWNAEIPSSTKKDNFWPLSVAPETNMELLNYVFKKTPHLKQAELITYLIVAFQRYDVHIGITKAKDYIAYYRKEGYLNKVGKDRSPRTYYEVNTAYLNNSVTPSI